MKRFLYTLSFGLFLLGMRSTHCLGQTPATTPAPNPASTPMPTPAPNDERTVTALLFEVRLLRIALQTVNTNSKRIQLMAERIRIQQSRVDKVASDIDQTREKITDTKTQLTKLAELAKEFETQLRLEPIAMRRVEIERQYRLSQLDVAPLRLRENQLNEREAALLNLYAAENAKLYDLQEKIDAMEREFEADAATERKANAESKKR